MREIKLSNGHKLRWTVASGAFGPGTGWWWDKVLMWLGFIDPTAFTIVAKTFTEWPRRGNFRWWAPWKTIQFINEFGDSGVRGFLFCQGMANAFGLRNGGARKWLGEFPKKANPKFSVIASISPDSETDMAGEIGRVAHEIRYLKHVKGIELNGSCPNKRGGILDACEITSCSEACKGEAPEMPLIVKLSVAHQPMLPNILPALRNIGVEAISINSVPWKMVFPKKESPLKKYGGGGVSGKPARKLMWEFASRILASTDIPLIFPAWDFQDIFEAKLMAGDRPGAISFGSVWLRHPTWPNKFIRQAGG